MNWIHCQIEYDKKREGGYFIAYGGPYNLEEMLTIFKEWVEK